MSDRQTLEVAIIGCGYWGPNYVRNFLEMGDRTKIICCDSDGKQLEKISLRFPGVSVCDDYRALLKRGGLDAAVVATPAATHFAVVRDCLEGGLHVLAEKPLALCSMEAESLCRLAEGNGRLLMVAHTFLFNSGVRKIGEMVREGRLGRLYYLNATRTHMGLVRRDTNVIWDLAPHDVAIFNYWLEQLPEYVMASGARHLGSVWEDAAFIHLVYPNEVLAHIHVSWEDANKERTIKVVGSKARAVFDDLNNLERVRVFEKGIGISNEARNFGEFQLLLRDGDIISPRLDQSEPLRVMCEHFVDCIRKGTKPLSDGRFALDVVRIIESVQKSVTEKCVVRLS